MKKILERIVASESAPGHYDLWVDTNNETPELKINYGYDKYSGWKTISGGGGSGEGEGGDVQIVELTYDHLPATGTLSASDLAKLDSDNCLLVMKGKYFRKTFSSSGGIDYKQIGLTTVLGGVRSIYFTASKPDGEYTIAYEHPVEANTQTEATTALENIKVGNTTYSVPKVVVIEGAYYGSSDSPIIFNDNKKESFAPTLSEGETYASVFDQVDNLLLFASVPTLVFVHYCSYDDGYSDEFGFSQIVGGGYDDNYGSYLSLNGAVDMRWVRGEDGGDDNPK